MTRDRPVPNWYFRGMAFLLRMFERFKKPRERLIRAGLKRGQIVLEYGCGAGSFTVPAATLVGPEGVVYALDIHPLAMDMVTTRLQKEGLSNVRMILSDRDTGLPDESVDIVLLYDTLHMVRDKQALLEELHRVLRADGLLSADHEHTGRNEFLETMTQNHLFELNTELGNVLGFVKADNRSSPLTSA